MQSNCFHDFMLIIILVTYLLGLRWPLANIVRDFVSYFVLVIHTLLKNNNCCPSLNSLVAFWDYVKAILKSRKNKDADESKNLGKEQANQNNNATIPTSDSSKKEEITDLGDGY